MMKKLFVYLLIVLLFGAVFGIAISNTTNIKEQTPVIGTVLEVFAIPGAAYAQDTGDIGIPPPVIPKDP